MNKYLVNKHISPIDILDVDIKSQVKQYGIVLINRRLYFNNNDTNILFLIREHFSRDYTIQYYDGIGVIDIKNNLLLTVQLARLVISADKIIKDIYGINA